MPMHQAKTGNSSSPVPNRRRPPPGDATPYSYSVAINPRQSTSPFVSSEEESRGTIEIVDDETVRIVFSDDDMNELLLPFRYALVGKFTRGAPKYRMVKKFLDDSKLSDAYIVGEYRSPKYFLIQLSNELDYLKLWLKAIWVVNGFPMRLFKWTMEFDHTHMH